MNTYKSSAQLKALARGQLAGKYPTAIGAFVLSSLIALLLYGVSALFTDTTTNFGMILSIPITFIVHLFYGILSAGQAYVFLNISCGRFCKASDVFYGFKQHPDKALLLQLVLTTISTVSMIPCTIFIYIGNYTMRIGWIFPICLFYMIGTIINTYFSLVFSQIFYLLLDFPDYSVKQILSLSKTIMKGHKGRLFYISISFLPLYLLGILSCGIAFLWIMPYYNATTTNFYLDLMKNRQP